MTKVLISGKISTLTYYISVRIYSFTCRSEVQLVRFISQFVRSRGAIKSPIISCQLFLPSSISSLEKYMHVCVWSLLPAKIWDSNILWLIKASCLAHDSHFLLSLIYTRPFVSSFLEIKQQIFYDSHFYFLDQQQRTIWPRKKCCGGLKKGAENLI